MRKITFFGLLMIAIYGGQIMAANLLLDEHFADTNYQDRGWATNPEAQAGYYTEQDSDLGRVMYNEWTGKGADAGRMPDNVNHGIRFPLTRAQIDSGITKYWVIKWHNMMENPATSDAAHNGVRGNFLQDVMGNVDGQWIIDNLSKSSGIRIHNGEIMDRGHNVVPRFSNYAPDRIPFLDTFSNGFVKTRTLSAYLTDDRWFEFVLYMDPKDAGPNGRAALWHRPYGTTTWTKNFDVTQKVCAGVGDEGMVGIGTYLHSRNGTAADPVRVYWGRYSVWTGNAMEDGTVDKFLKGAEEPAPAPTPTPPPVSEDISGGLEISDLQVTVQADKASILWSTNKPANSVVDFGPTDQRGEIVRDDHLKTEHEVVLVPLEPETTYYFRFSSKDAGGGVAMDMENSSFTTPAMGAAPIAPPENLKILIELEREPLSGEGVMFDGEKWVLINLRDEVKKIIEGEVKLTLKS